MTVEIPFDGDGNKRVGQEMQYPLDGIGSPETQSSP